MTESNFIEDPDQYFDHLPQPYNFLHNLVSRILDSAWDEFLLSEKVRHEHSNLDKLSVSPVNQTDIPDEITCVELVSTEIHSDENEVISNTMLVLANRNHMLYFPAICSYQTQEPSFQHKLPADSPLKQIYVFSASDRYSLIRGYDLQERVQYCAITQQESYVVCSLPDADSIVVTAVREDDPYIVFTCSENDATFLLVFSFPLTQWTETIGSLLSLQEEESESNKPNPSFTKPTLLGKISKPQPLHPTNLFGTKDRSAFTDPKAHFNGVAHALSHEYFRNVSKNFNARMNCESELITPTSITVPLFSPHFNVVLAEGVGKKELVIWWEGSCDIMFYSFSSPPKDINVYPVSYMNQASPIISSSVSTAGHVYVMGFHACITVWKFPHKHLIKFLEIGEYVDVSHIEFIPSLDVSTCTDQFICVAAEKSYAVKIDAHRTEIKQLNQTDEPILPAILETVQLFVSPSTHLLMFSHVHGVRSVRDIAASPPTLISILQSASSTTVAVHLSRTDKQLYLAVADTHSSRMLLRYDLSQKIVNRLTVYPDIHYTPPSEEDMRKPLYYVEGNNSIKKIALDMLNEKYSQRETIRAKAKQVWNELDEFFKQ